jgi:two-component system chemotaxis sensor kinase CheA
MQIDMAAAVTAFLVEGRELLADLEQGLLRLDRGHDRGDAELINAMFRAAHTIKGSGGIVGIDGVARFTHHVETLMDRVRAGELQLDDATVTLLLGCCDHIGRLLDAAAAGDVEGHGLEADGRVLLEGLRARSAAPAAAPVAAAAAGAQNAPPSAASAGGFRVAAVFGRDSLRDGIDPASALVWLGEQVAIGAVRLLDARVPALDGLDPEDCWIAVALRAAGDPARAAEAFEFCGEDAAIALLPDGEAPQAVAQRLAPVLAALGEPAALQPWVDAGLLAAGEWEPPAAVVAAPAGAVPASVAPAAAAAPSASAQPSAAPARFVRVPAERLDELIRQVGELVIASAGVDLLARQTRQSRLQESVSALTQMVDALQSGALQLRMVPVGETFARFQRVVRDVSRELGKDIALEIVGGETELDKSMVERVFDPLMHLVRNAMDHGLETPEARLAAGKPGQGTLRLKASHDSGNIVIEVSDDGRGLDRDRILAKAVERGLVQPGEELSDAEVFQLVFEPGFSTAAQVTQLSGRGVGMDVVKRAIESLRGAITLHSQRGEGTLVQLRLPLTLAIIDGFMVSVGASRFILPLDLVVECIELPADALTGDAPRYLNLRDEVLPYISLRDFFGVPGAAARRSSVVVVRSGDTKAGVLVDALHGEIQTVIKPMSRIFQHLRAVGGTSILGSGDIALIVDIHQLVQRSVDRALRAPAATAAA